MSLSASAANATSTFSASSLFEVGAMCTSGRHPLSALVPYDDNYFKVGITCPAYQEKLQGFKTFLYELPQRFNLNAITNARKRFNDAYTAKRTAQRNLFEFVENYPVFANVVSFLNGFASISGKVLLIQFLKLMTKVLEDSYDGEALFSLDGSNCLANLRDNVKYARSNGLSDRDAINHTLTSMFGVIHYQQPIQFPQILPSVTIEEVNDMEDEDEVNSLALTLMSIH